jgi:1,2-diacylglycerol 3-beta-glucosyltransferase
MSNSPLFQANDSISLILTIIWIPVLIYLSFSVFYYFFLAITYYVTNDKKKTRRIPEHHYLVFVPAHNEEVLIGRLLDSFKTVDYRPNNFRTYVIADNCTDQTAEIARQYGVDVLVRNDEVKKGKGFAIEWALTQTNINDFDALVIVDLDNIVHPNFFRGIDTCLADGNHAVQCNNTVCNPNDSAFTKCIHLSRTINNEFYHHAKHRLGLYSYLMGNGMCFTKKLLQDHPWSTKTMAEDYEYYATLVKSNVHIGFAWDSILYQEESTGLRSAFYQRLRWSSGRFNVAKKQGLRLFIKGLVERKFKTIDASFALILPNLSLMVNMSIAAFIAAAIIHYFHPMPFVVAWLGFLIILELAYYLGGIALTRMRIGTALYALGFAPFFLFWKGFIDILGISGTGMGKWGKSERNQPISK